MVIQLCFDGNTPHYLPLHDGMASVKKKKSWISCSFGIGRRIDWAVITDVEELADAFFTIKQCHYQQRFVKVTTRTKLTDYTDYGGVSVFEGARG